MALSGAGAHSMHQFVQTYLLLNDHDGRKRFLLHDFYPGSLVVNGVNQIFTPLYFCLSHSEWVDSLPSVWVEAKHQDENPTCLYALICVNSSSGALDEP